MNKTSVPSMALVCALALLALAHTGILALVSAIFWYSAEKGMCPRSTWKLGLAYVAIPAFIAVVCMTLVVLRKNWLPVTALRWFICWSIVAGGASVSFVLGPWIPGMISACSYGR